MFQVKAVQLLNGDLGWARILKDGSVHLVSDRREATRLHNFDAVELKDQLEADGGLCSVELRADVPSTGRAPS